MIVTTGAKTDPGQRPNNEDHYAVVDTRGRGIRADGVLVIADGMGGRSFGEQAAEAAVETVEETLAEMLDVRREGEVVIADALASALRKANARVYELARADDERKGMGTTCVAAIVEGETLYVAHAGDSRAYLLREGELNQLTADHSYVAEQVRAGAISEEGARKSRFRNIITRAVGIEPSLEAEVGEHEVRAGDWLLLCTDGLSNMLTEQDIARTLGQSTSPQAAADKLVGMAGKAGGKDNITAVVARFGVGTRTQRMRTTDLARPKADGRDAADVPEEDAPAQRRNGSAPAAPRSRRGSPVWPLLAVLLIALGAGASGWLGSLLVHAGYRFQAAPPFAVKPVPLPPPTPPNPTAVAYDTPKPFYYNPVRGDLLDVSPKSGLVTVATLAGTVVGLAPDDGHVLYKYRLPSLHAQSPAPAGALGAAGATTHTAVDSQGNLYVSDALAKTVTKYRSNGDPLGLVAHLTLTNPQAIGVTGDGTIYLVDAERLKVLRAHPSSTPLPPIPSPKPPAPKPTLPTMPLLSDTPDAATPVPTYDRHYRHYGTGYRHYGTGFRHRRAAPAGPL